MKSTQYQPKTGQACSCRPGIARDNCPQCEGTGQRIDFRAIRERTTTENIHLMQPVAHCEAWEAERALTTSPRELAEAAGPGNALLDGLTSPNYEWPLTDCACPSGDGYAAHQVIDGECAQCGQREAEEQRAEYETDLAKDPHEQAMREEYFERKGREQD